MMMWFPSVMSYNVSIIRDWLRSPHTILLVHSHKFHTGKVIPRDDWDGMSMYWPHLMTQAERFPRLIMCGVFKLVNQVERFPGLILCFIFGFVD